MKKCIFVSVPTTPPPPKCNISKLNIMFLVDGSGSVPVSTFREFKQFMQLLVKRFTIGPNDTHIGALQYCSKPGTALEFELGKHQTAEAVQEAISKIIYHYGAYTFAGNAMRIAKEVRVRAKWVFNLHYILSFVAVSVSIDQFPNHIPEIVPARFSCLIICGSENINRQTFSDN